MPCAPFAVSVPSAAGSVLGPVPGEPAALVGSADVRFAWALPVARVLDPLAVFGPDAATARFAAAVRVGVVRGGEARFADVAFAEVAFGGALVAVDFTAADFTAAALAGVAFAGVAFAGVALVAARFAGARFAVGLADAAFVGGVFAGARVAGFCVAAFAVLDASARRSAVGSDVASGMAPDRAAAAAVEAAFSAFAARWRADALSAVAVTRLACSQAAR